ncbi:hypothetical protein V5799_032477, partial [Amblyomma americanum]
VAVTADPTTRLICSDWEGEEPRHGHESLRRLFLANRTLPLALSFTSMTATWVGAGYINGTAEAVFNYGLVWCQTPLGYAISLVIGKRQQVYSESRSTRNNTLKLKVYFQRVLSCDSAFSAKFLSYMSALGCVFFALPSVVVGALARSTNFTAAGYEGEFNLNEEDRKDVLPYTLHYLTPDTVSILGQLAITSAVMSSVDSSMMSASSLVTHNVYHQLLRPAASLWLW